MKEGRKASRKEGMIEGSHEGGKEGSHAGRQAGMHAGSQGGRQEGRKAGRQEGRKEEMQARRSTYVRPPIPTSPLNSYYGTHYRTVLAISYGTCNRGPRAPGRGWRHFYSSVREYRTSNRSATVRDCFRTDRRTDATLITPRPEQTKFVKKDSLVLVSQSVSHYTHQNQ